MPIPAFTAGGPILQRMRIAPGADLTADPDTYSWQDITPDLRKSEPVSVVVGSEDEQPESFSSMTFALRNDRSRVPAVDGAVGRYTSDNPFSDLFPDFEQNCPVEYALSLDGGSAYEIQARMYLSEINDEVRKTDELVVTRCTAGGVFRRMSNWEDLQSAMFRSMSGITVGDYVPRFFWPLTDGAGSTFFAPTTPNTYNGYPTNSATFPNPEGVAFADSEVVIGSEPLPAVGAGSYIICRVPDYADSGQWAVQYCTYLPTASNASYAQVLMGGASTHVLFIEILPSSDLVAYFIIDVATGAALFSGGVPIDRSLLVGQPLSVVVAMTATGGGPGDTFTTRILDSTGATLGTLSATNTSSYGPFKNWAGQNASVAGLDPVIFGMVGVFTDAGFDVATDGVEGARAMSGWIGEHPSERLERLCRELGIPFEAFGDDLNDQFVMGPQPTGKALDVFRDCERTGHGFLTDHLGKVQYYTLDASLGQTPFVAVDASQRELFLPFLPVTDDLGRANIVTASQPNGSSVTVRSDDDINGVPHYRPARGEYKGDLSANIQDPRYLADHAGAVVSRGTVLGKRYPNVTLDGIRKKAQATAAISGLIPRALLALTNPPTAQRQDDVGLIVKGWTLTVLGPRQALTWQLNTTRDEPYRRLQYDGTGARKAKYQSKSTVLDGGITSSATAVLVDSGGEVWATTASHPAMFPLDVVIGGITYACSAITGTAPAYTLTITRLATDRAHADGTPVRVKLNGTYGL